MPHIHEKIDFCVDVLVVFKNRVLLRFHEKHNMWLAPGGHIELDEDPIQAALREVFEETGLKVTLHKGYAKPSGSPHDLLPPRFLNRHSISDTHEHVSLIYLARSETDKCVIPDNHEKAECRWFTKDELDNPKLNLGHDIKHYAKAALDELGE